MRPTADDDQRIAKYEADQFAREYGGLASRRKRLVNRIFLVVAILLALLLIFSLVVRAG